MKISNRYKHPKFLFMAVKILMGIAHNEIFNVLVVVKNGRIFWLNVNIKAALITRFNSDFSDFRQKKLKSSSQGLSNQISLSHIWCHMSEYLTKLFLNYDLSTHKKRIVFGNFIRRQQFSFGSYITAVTSVLI